MTDLRNLGIDIGGVIIDRINDDTDTSFFSDNYLNTSPVPWVFESIKELQDVFEVIFLVSKCGQRTQDRTMKWLAHHDFYSRTGVSENHVLFCRKRHEKAPICEKFGITSFVDDRLEVLKYMDGIVNNLYLFQPNQEEVKKHINFLHRVKHFDRWLDMTKYIKNYEALSGKI